MHSILALLLDRVNGQRNAPAALLSRKEPLSPMDRRLGGPQGHCGRFGAESLCVQPLDESVICAVFARRKCGRNTHLSYFSLIGCLLVF